MADFLRDVGLKYADTLPVALGTCLAVLVGLAWLGWMTSESDLEPKPLIYALLAGAAIAVVVQFPAATDSARDYCRSLAASSSDTTELGGRTYTVEGPDSVEYRLSDCASVWPDGPDGGD